MTEADHGRIQQSISADLAVSEDFDAHAELERRIEFVKNTVTGAHAGGVVLAISGGVDSSLAGRLCQLAVERIRSAGGDARFIAMRMPYGIQHDEEDAALALEFIEPDEVHTVNIREASDKLLEAVASCGLNLADGTSSDFILGNIKARQRMVAQYAVAGARGMLVAGTDHAAEAVMGFFTKYGDGACDFTPLSGLTKRRVRALASELGAQERLTNKVPTADLESDSPGLPDEQVFGISYADIDDFLEGKKVSASVHETIVSWYKRSAHKRTTPLAVD